MGRPQVTQGLLGRWALLPRWEEDMNKFSLRKSKKGYANDYSNIRACDALGLGL